ncbi:hypothetical protein O1611_g4719 [Lasiodiplodia mahajangana]|uniref:Uncharacterized protein n=1 Tax=Lasiodiplodia mahajangana TaxID=1108764 RepID=A0ACC2JN27_9PEZI|nr:hypothetical protein O1611_g4719 [Lasiodiplodia mahajangana]
MDQSAKLHEEILTDLSAETQDTSQRSTATVPEQKATSRLLAWRENPLFFGHDVELDVMFHELLDSTDKQLRIFSLVGMAGVGKSQLALRFAYKHSEKLDAIFWIPADEPAKLAQGFVDIAKELRLIEDTTSISNNVVRRRVLDWLKRTTQTWLLVLDNVQDMRILQDYWPIGSNGRIIITSRNHAATEQPVTASKLIEPFNPEDGAAAFLSFLPEHVRREPNAQINAHAISITCGGLPLALRQCANLLKVKNISIEELSLICSDTASLVQPHSLLNTTSGQDYYYNGNLSTIWQGALTALSETSIFMLRLLSWFDPDSIPEVLMKPDDGQLHEAFRTHLVNEADYDIAIESLLSQGLVNKGTHSGVFIMHRLVQAMAIQSMSSEDGENIFKLVLTLLDAAIPLQENWEQQTGDWDRYDRALPHIERLEFLRRELQIEPEPRLAHLLGSVFERTGWYLYEKGLLDESSDLLSKAESVAKNAAGSTNLDQVEDELLKDLLYDVTNDRACIKFAECRFEEAKELYTQCLSLKEAMNSPSQNELCLLTNNVGNALANMGLVDEAYVWLEKAFDMRQEVVASARNPEIYKDQLARDWGTLAGCLWLKGDYSTAWEYANNSTKLCEEIYADNNLVVAGYGKILAEEGNTLEAIECVKRAIGILSDNPHFKAANARSHYYLAKLLEGLSDSSSMPYLETAVLLYSEHVGISLEAARGINLTMGHFDKLISCWHW